MSNIVKVRLTQNDQFVVTDPVTGIEKVVSSSVLHAPNFITTSSVKHFLCEEFGAADWDCSADALERIRGITDFNTLNDEVRF